MHLPEEYMERALEASPLFSGMSGREASLCLACSGASEEHHGKGSLVFTQNQTRPKGSMCCLKSTVNVCRESAGGRRAVMARVDAPGDLLARCMFFWAPPQLRVQRAGRTPVRVLGIPARFFYATCEKPALCIRA